MMPQNTIKNISLLIIFAFLATFVFTTKPAFSSTAIAEDFWVEKTLMPTARGYLGVVTEKGKIYAIGGSGPIGVNEEYDPATDSWATKASMPYPEQSFAIAACKGRVYCIGGLSLNDTGLNQVYDPSKDSWQIKTSMPTSRHSVQAQVVGDKIYLIGGVRLRGYNEGYEELNLTEVYDPSSDTWTTKAPMPNSSGCVSAVLDDKIHVVGRTTQIYNPKTDSWSTGASPLIELGLGANGLSATAASTTGKMAPKRIYVYDGSSLQIYNPENDSWTFGTPPPTSRQYLGIGIVDDKLFFIGGFTFTDTRLYIDYSTNEVYTPIGFGTISETLPTATSSPAGPEPTVPTPTASQEPIPLPAAAVTVSGALAAVIVVGLVIYVKKHRH